MRIKLQAAAIFKIHFTLVLCLFRPFQDEYFYCAGSDVVAVACDTLLFNNILSFAWYNALIRIYSFLRRQTQVSKCFACLFCSQFVPLLVTVVVILLLLLENLQR